MKIITLFAAIVIALSTTQANACAAAVQDREPPRRAGGDDGGLAGSGIPALTTIRVASGVTRPIFATFAPGDPTRLFIVEKHGRIRVLKINTNPPTLLATPFLDIDAQIAGGTSQPSEQGLLGLAFHPRYQQNGVFYVYYTANSFANTIARFQVSGNPDVANGSGTTGAIVLQIADSESNHNGGWIGFKPGDTQGYLYVATGDGGGSNDNHGSNGNAQDINSLLGKILRLDIDGADNSPGNGDDDTIADSSRNYSIPASNPFASTAGENEIWSYGLRNPYRCSFDRSNGDLYIGDVGQGSWEEVNLEASNSSGGVNYGWRCMEGNNCTGLSGCTCEIGCAGGPLKCPIYQYSHDGEVCAIACGYVYRGSRMPALGGTFFFADYNCSIPGSAPIWSFKVVGGAATQFQTRTSELAPGSGLVVDTLTSFGEDFYGEMYICDQEGGEIFKIVPRCVADTNFDGSRNVTDLLAVINAWGACPPPNCPPDINLDSAVNVTDLLSVINNWGACPP